MTLIFADFFMPPWSRHWWVPQTQTLWFHWGGRGCCLHHRWGLSSLPFFSYQSSSVDPALVPPVRRSAGDEAQVHVEHLPVYWICRRARPDQGEVTQLQGRHVDIMNRGDWGMLSHFNTLLYILEPQLLKVARLRNLLTFPTVNNIPHVLIVMPTSDVTMTTVVLWSDKSGRFWAICCKRRITTIVFSY